MVQGPLSCSLKWCVLGLPQYFEISLCCCCIVAKSCPTLCNPMDCSQAALSMESSGKNTGVGCHLKLGRRFFVSPWMSFFSLHWRRQMPLFLSGTCVPTWSWAYRDAGRKHISSEGPPSPGRLPCLPQLDELVVSVDSAALAWEDSTLCILLFVCMKVKVAPLCLTLCDPIDSRPEYWSGWPFTPPGDLPNPGI